MAIGGGLHDRTLPRRVEHASVLARPASRTGTRSAFYVWIALAMCATVFFGFWFTYFGPLLRGSYPAVPWIVHLHGWSYFLWYLLFATQAWLVRGGRLSTHRASGLASTALAAVMISVGLIVATNRVDESLSPDANPFWKLMALPIFSIWVLFTGFYVAAFRRRRRAAEHKRLMLLASSAALSAATFRIVVDFLGFERWTAIAGTLAPGLFILAAMIHDHRTAGTIHRVYAWGFPATMGVIAGAFLIGAAPEAAAVREAVAWVGRLLRPLY